MHALRAGRGVELHRDRDQAEGDRARRRWHVPPWRTPSLGDGERKVPWIGRPMRDLETYRRKRDPARTPGALRRRAARRARCAPGAPRGASWCSSTRRGDCTTTCASRSTACWRAGRCRRARRSTPRSAASRCARRTIPLEYADFEGVIPAGQLRRRRDDRVGRGRLPQRATASRPTTGLEEGKLDLVLEGQKLRGRFALVRTRGAAGKDWLLLRKGAAPPDGRDLVRDAPASVLSGLTVEELRGGRHARRGASTAALAQAPRAAARARSRRAASDARGARATARSRARAGSSS